MWPAYPLARSEGLLVEDLDGQLLLYDTDSNLAHALNWEAGALWRACDGRTDTRTLALRCGTSPDNVRLTLGRLAQLGLLEDGQDGDTRRDLLRKITVTSVGLAAVPTISSIIVPTAAQAASGAMFTEYTIPSGHVPDQITAGPDGALWFTENQSDYIGRITTSGEVTEYSIVQQTGNDITGAYNALWFTEEGASQIGQMTTSGQVTEYTIPSGHVADQITAGPDGALWFTEKGNDVIGRFSPP